MSLEDFELVEEKVQDIRFGIINIFNSQDDKEYLIMEKSRRSYSQEDHAFSCMQAEERLKIQHPNILRMLWVDKDDLNWMTSAYFEYPNEDLGDRKEELNDPRELIRLLNDILEAMTYLQQHKMVHGDIRPEYIFFNQATDRYVLLDRLIDASPAHQAQMNNIFYQDKTLYMSPVLFNELCQGNLRIKHNPFKSEVFSLGMVILSIFIDETDVDRCFNRRQKEFDYREFTMIADHLKNTVFTGNIEDLLGEYLFLCILNLNEKERLSPKKALKILRKGICKALNTIVPNPQIQIPAERNIPTDNEEVNSEARNLWEYYHSAKEKIEAESQTEKESNMTGSLKSGTHNFVNDEKLNMPNMGGDAEDEEEEEEEQASDEFGYNESMPVNSNNLLIKEGELESINKSNSISYMKEYQSGKEKKVESGLQSDEILKRTSFNQNIKESDAFDSKVNIEGSSMVRESDQEEEVEIEMETEDIPDEKQDANKLRIFEVMNDNSMSGTNHNEDTFYGSGSNQGDKIMGLNDIYEQDINKLQNFLQNTGEEEHEHEQESRDDIVLSKRSEKNSQRLYQSNASGYESEKPNDLVNFQSYSKVEDKDLGINEIGLPKEEGDEVLPEAAQLSTKEIKRIFRGRSDEDLRGNYFEDIKGADEFDIDENNLALGEILQKFQYQSGEDYVELAGKTPGSTKEIPLDKNEQHYFSYRTDLEGGGDGVINKIPFQQRSPDFGKKEMINLEKLKWENMNIQIVGREGDEEDNDKEQDESNPESNGRVLSKLKINQFSMSNKEFLKSQEETMKLTHRGNTLKTKDLLIHEVGTEEYGFNNTNTFYVTPGEDISLGDTFDKQMKMKLQEEGVQIVEGELKVDSDRELSSRVIADSIAKNFLGMEGQSEETHQLKKSVSIESDEECQKKNQKSEDNADNVDDIDSEKLSDVEQISIDTDEFLKENSGISSRLNSPTFLKTEKCIKDMKIMKDQIHEERTGKGESKSNDLASPEKIGSIQEPLNEGFGSIDAVQQKSSSTMSNKRIVNVWSLEINKNVDKLLSEGKRSVDEKTRKYFEELGISIHENNNCQVEDLRRSHSDKEFDKKTQYKIRNQTNSEMAIKYSFKKKGNELPNQKEVPIEIVNEFEDLVIIEDVDNYETKEQSEKSDKSYKSHNSDKSYNSDNSDQSYNKSDNSDKSITSESKCLKSQSKDSKLEEEKSEHKSVSYHSSESYNSKLKDKFSENKNDSSKDSSSNNFEITNPKLIKKESIFINNNSIPNLEKNGDKKKIKKKKEKNIGLEELEFINSLVKYSVWSLTKDIKFNLVQNDPDKEKSIAKSEKKEPVNIEMVNYEHLNEQDKMKEKEEIDSRREEETESVLLTEEDHENERRNLSGLEEPNIVSPRENISFEIVTNEGSDEVNEGQENNPDQDKNSDILEGDLDIAEIESENTVKIFMNCDLGKMIDSGVDPRGSLPVMEDFQDTNTEGGEIKKQNFMKKSMETRINTGGREKGYELMINSVPVIREQREESEDDNPLEKTGPDHVERESEHNQVVEIDEEDRNDETKTYLTESINSLDNPSDDSDNSNQFRMIIKKKKNGIENSEPQSKESEQKSLLDNITGEKMESISENMSNVGSSKESNSSLSQKSNKSDSKKKEKSWSSDSEQEDSTESISSSKIKQKAGSENSEEFLNDEQDDRIDDAPLNTVNENNEIDFGVYGTDKTGESSSEGSQTLKAYYLKNPSIFKTINFESGIENEEESRNNSQIDEEKDSSRLINKYKRKMTDTSSKKQQTLLEDALKENTEDNSLIMKSQDESLEENKSSSVKDKEGQLIDIIDGENGHKMEIEAGNELILSEINKQSSSDQFRPITEVTEEPSIMEGNRVTDRKKSSQKILKRVPESKESKQVERQGQSNEEDKKDELNLEVIAKEIQMERGKVQRNQP